MAFNDLCVHYSLCDLRQGDDSLTAHDWELRTENCFLQIITLPWRTIILYVENEQLEGKGPMYSNANIVPQF